MGKSRKSSSALELQRKQIHTRLTNLPSLESPRDGWIRTIRQSLGMTMRQLGARLAISPQGVRDIEMRERNETITVAKLRQAADALNCDLRLVLIPRTSLETTMRKQAATKAREERNRLVHTMHLEDQDAGVEDALDESKAAARWLTGRIARLWD